MDRSIRSQRSAIPTRLFIYYFLRDNEGCTIDDIFYGLFPLYKHRRDLFKYTKKLRNKNLLRMCNKGCFKLINKGGKTDQDYL